MDYLNKVLILKKYFHEYIKNKDLLNTTKTLNSIKSIHGKIIELILKLKDSNEDNKLEVLSDLEIVNFKMITLINECNDLVDNNTNIIELTDENNNQDDNDNDNNIIELTDDNNNEDDINNISVKLPSLILFHAEWCGHCKALMPIWNKLKAMIEKNTINLVKISCVKKQEQCNKMKFIKGYPTIIFVPIVKTLNNDDNLQNKMIIYNGERTADSIIKFIKDNL